MNKDIIQGLLRCIAKEMGLQDDIEVTDVRGSKIIIDYKQDPNKPLLSKSISKLAYEAKCRILSPIELILELDQKPKHINLL